MNKKYIIFGSFSLATLIATFLVVTIARNRHAPKSPVKNGVFSQISAKQQDRMLHDCAGAGSECALSNAIVDGKIDLAFHLIAAGASVNDKFPKKNGHLSPLGAAIGIGNAKLVKLLISKGADINESQTSFPAPIYLAVGSAKPKQMLSILINAGVDLDRSSLRFSTALEMAQAYQVKDAIVLLKAAKLKRDYSMLNRQLGRSPSSAR